MVIIILFVCLILLLLNRAAYGDYCLRRGNWIHEWRCCPTARWIPGCKGKSRPEPRNRRRTRCRTGRREECGQNFGTAPVEGNCVGPNYTRPPNCGPQSTPSPKGPVWRGYNTGATTAPYQTRVRQSVITKFTILTSSFLFLQQCQRKTRTHGGTQLLFFDVDHFTRNAIVALVAGS